VRNIVDLNQPVLFLGIADFVEEFGAPFPLGVLDMFQLSQHKAHIIFPAIITGNEWVLMVSTSFFENRDLSKWSIRIADEHDAEFGRLNFSSISKGEQVAASSEEPKGASPISIVKDAMFTIIHFKIDSLVNQPGRYVVQSIYDEKPTEIGSVHFHYQKSQSLTPDQIKAIESDANSAKAIIMELGCKFCPTKLKAYTGLTRQPELEREGCVWQTNLGKEFQCECGKTNYSLEYLRESMHGMLLKDFSRDTSRLGYVRRYGHLQVCKIVEDYQTLLNTERLEPPVQKFLEKYPILLSRFNAKRLYIKPNIIGKFEADFAIVDSRNQLWLIELEKPSMPLFKRNGHPTQALMHAYGQVTDWLHQYNKYPGAILDTLNLKEGDIVSTRGAVIAGRSAEVSHKVLHRHLSNPPYPNIEFMTCDDLGASLLELSKKLA